jgi:hypothetical protein
MGLPLWGQLVRALLAWAESLSLFEPALAKSLHDSLESDADLVADQVFEAARSHNQLDRLTDQLKEMFLGPATAPGPNHERLRRIGFAAVLTTNFDNLLERSFGDTPIYTPRETEPLLEALSRHEFFLLKLYGTLNRPDSVLVAPRQYEDEIVGNAAFSQFMESLFVSRTLLFVGASLAGIEAYLRGVRFRGNLSRRHYALVAVTGTAWLAKAEALRHRYQIEVLPYDVSPDHREVDGFLEDLQTRSRTIRGGDADPSGARRKAAWLRQVELNGVGPFARLELELDRQWNVLLGDNGVGKSSVLRAVAAALCGQEAQAYADRLIQSSTPTAQVVLKTSDDKENVREYVTQLARTSSGAEIRTLPGRLLEHEGWLAIGFPALRTVSWRRAAGPQVNQGRRRPNPEDLLPLVAGEPDPRMDGLKQWIVNLDYRTKDTSDPQSGHYQQLLKKFFEVIRQLTGGLKIEFARVDIDRGRVLVETDDGEVPLEAMSQGTVSLLGWVGVLMQRLYEVYEDNPLEQYALVLMDEIDAHMHPEWQQRLVPTLKQLFPNVQFLVTTHSPLIVGGMDVKHVIRFVRRDGAVVREELEPDATMGRADQVLTAGGFGLDTTVDGETQKEIDDYSRLLAKERLGPEDRKEIDRLRRTLAFRLPPPPEGLIERRAQDLLKALLRCQVGDDHADAQTEVLAKARRLFDELRKGEGGGP